MKDWYKSKCLWFNSFSTVCTILFLFSGSIYSTARHINRDNPEMLALIEIWKGELVNALGVGAVLGSGGSIVDRLSKGDLYTPKRFPGPTKF